MGTSLQMLPLPSSHENRISFCNPSFFSSPHWISPFSGLYLCLWHILPVCPKKEDLTQSCTAWMGSKAAWDWQGVCFAVTLQGILTDFPFLLWALSRRCLWTLPTAGGAGNGKVLTLPVLSALYLCRPCILRLPTLTWNIAPGVSLHSI